MECKRDFQPLICPFDLSDAEMKLIFRREGARPELLRLRFCKCGSGCTSIYTKVCWYSSQWRAGLNMLLFDLLLVAHVCSSRHQLAGGSMHVTSLFKTACWWFKYNPQDTSSLVVQVRPSRYWNVDICDPPLQNQSLRTNFQNWVIMIF